MTPHVLSIGELLVEVMRTGVDQPLSEPGPFVGPFPSGAPAIFIDAVARLGVSAGFIGAVGADAFGDCVISRLQADGVDISQCRTLNGMTTGIAFVSYQRDGSRNFVFHLPQSAAAQITAEDVDADYVSGAQFLHITGSALATSDGMRQACYRAVQLCKAAGGRISFDPNVRPELLGLDRLRQICAPVLETCDVLFPSGAEARFLTGIEDETAACRALVGRDPAGDAQTGRGRLDDLYPRWDDPRAAAARRRGRSHGSGRLLRCRLCRGVAGRMAASPGRSLCQHCWRPLRHPPRSYGGDTGPGGGGRKNE
jgi:sugar/nucleoside kinase (ribokinase family)